MKRPSKIFVLGSINMDVAAMVERHPKIGETVFGANLGFFLGGKGANQAVAARRGGAEVVMYGRVGRDDFGKSLVKSLRREGIGIAGIRFDPAASTGTALIIVGKSGDNSIVVLSGANFRVRVADIDLSKLAKGDFVLSQLEVPQEAIAKVFDIAKRRGAKTVLNVAPAQKLMEKLYKNADIIIVNEIELAFLSGKKAVLSPGKIAEQAARLTKRKDQMIVVTRGARGALVYAGKSYFTVPGHKVRAIDTTGAGDCFVGNFIAALSKGYNPRKAAELANAAAALSVGKKGAAASMPSVKESKKFLGTTGA